MEHSDRVMFYFVRNNSPYLANERAAFLRGAAQRLEDRNVGYIIDGPRDPNRMKENKNADESDDGSNEESRGAEKGPEKEEKPKRDKKRAKRRKKLED